MSTRWQCLQVRRVRHLDGLKGQRTSACAFNPVDTEWAVAYIDRVRERERERERERQHLCLNMSNADTSEIITPHTVPLAKQAAKVYCGITLPTDPTYVLLNRAEQREETANLAKQLSQYKAWQVGIVMSSYIIWETPTTWSHREYYCGSMGYWALCYGLSSLCMT